MKLSRWIPRLVAIALIAAVTAFLVVDKPWAKGAPKVTFSTVAVGKGTIAAQVTASGTLSARTTVQVGAQVTGRVVELDADFNTPVKKGQILAKLDPSIYQAALDQSQAAYDLALANEQKAEAALMDGERQYKRQKGLEDQQLVAGATVETYQLTYLSAKAALDAAKASVKQAAANLAQAKANLGYCTIYSPIDGVVLTRNYDLGQTVQSSFSAPTLFTIAEDLSHMQIDTSVAEGDIGQLEEGVKADFTVDAFPGKTFHGTVRQVRNSPTTNQGVVTYDAVIDVDNEDHALRPGMTASVTFVLASVENAIKIPNAALRFKPSRDQMMALAEIYGFRRGMHHHDSGAPGGAGGGPSGGAGGASGTGGAQPHADATTGASGGGMKGLGDRKPLWKLVDGKPHMVLVKLGLSDGSSTQLLDGDVAPGDQLITEIQGLPERQRKLGAF